MSRSDNIFPFVEVRPAQPAQPIEILLLAWHTSIELDCDSLLRRAGGSIARSG